MNELENQREDEKIAAAYAVQRGLEGFRQGSGQAAPILYNDLFKYVRGVTNLDAARIEQAVGSDLRLRRTYLDLVKDRQRFFMPKAAAASSDTLLRERDSEHFTIKVVSSNRQRSKGQASQYYIILQLKSQQLAEEGAELVLHVTNGESIARCNFPPLQDGRTQVVVEEDDGLFNLITDMDAEITIH